MAKQPRSLAGKVVAVTGGARGIGRATAAALAREGAKVAIGDLDREGAEATASHIGSGAIGLELNVTDRPSFEGFVAQVEEQLGPLDVLVNNAGIMPLGPLWDESDATAKRQIDINLHGVLFGTKIALESMRPRNTGHIVNIASVAGKSGFPGGATYCATKHAVVGLSEALRAELRDSGLEVSVVMPGVVNTELASGLPTGRGVKAVEPEDVAQAIVDALRFPRFDVFVPKELGTIGRVMQLVPRRAAEAIGRYFKADQMLWSADKQARQAYEARAARSEPGVEEHAEEPAKATP
jgi:NAD(P)-dependent dehydrogenase (short-subunit alcohol dehydrogenase family)